MSLETRGPNVTYDEGKILISTSPSFSEVSGSGARHVTTNISFSRTPDIWGNIHRLLFEPITTDFLKPDCWWIIMALWPGAQARGHLTPLLKRPKESDLQRQRSYLKRCWKLRLPRLGPAGQILSTLLSLSTFLS